MLEKIRKFRCKYPLLFCIIAVFLCWLIGLKGAGALYGATIEQIPMDSRLEDGVSVCFCDGSIIIVGLIILAISGRICLMTKRGQGFKGLKVAAVPLIFYCVVIAMFAAVFALVDPSLLKDGKVELHPSFDFASVVIIISYCFVGLAEELMCRGIVAQTLFERYGTKRAAVWKAVIISGLIFGLLHTSNLSALSPAFVVGQIISAIGAGILYGSIYFRTGNIWIIALAHALNDIMATASIWMGGVDSATALSSVGGEVSAFPVVMAVIEALIGVFLLRKKKFGEIEQNWPELKEWNPAGMASAAPAASSDSNVATASAPVAPAASSNSAAPAASSDSATPIEPDSATDSDTSTGNNASADSVDSK